MENVILEFFGGDTLTLAGLFLLVLGYVSGRRSTVAHGLPAEVKGYKFVNRVASEHSNAKFSVGLYRNAAGAEAYVKQWSGSYRDDAYYALKNEIQVYRYFQKVFAGQSRHVLAQFPDVVLPELIAAEEDAERLLLCIGKVPGSSLKAYGDDASVAAVTRILDFLQAVDRATATEQQDLLQEESLRGFLWLMPLLVLKTLVTQPNMARHVIRAVWVWLRSLPAWFRSDVTLVHRDLTVYNIFIDRDRIGLIDFEATLRAPMGLELAQTVVGFFDQPSFIAQLYRTPHMTAILSKPDSFNTYRAASLYVAFLHLATRQVFSREVYQRYLIHILQLKPIT